jgi:CDP-diacylglycerol---glycerol-3-phosphate 3-phosphatidyltransferase
VTAEPHAAPPGPEPGAPTGPAAAPADRQAGLFNAANGLTAGRLLLVPVFGAFMITSAMTDARWRIAACLTFVAASLTDYIDGWVARRRNLVTSFGKVADPIADKALTGTALLLLSAYARVPWWITAVILVREFGITALRFAVLRRVVIPASPGGKLKTALQVLAIAWYLWPLPPALAAAGPWLMYLAAAVTVATGVDYLVRAVWQRRTQRTP